MSAVLKTNQPRVQADQAPAAIEFELDGRAVQAHVGETILQAAERHGVEIPRLCYTEGLRADGNCRACVVEIEGERTLAPSCSRAVQPGMKVKATSERARKSQDMVLEMLLAELALAGNRPADAEQLLTRPAVAADASLEELCALRRADILAARAGLRQRNHKLAGNVLRLGGQPTAAEHAAHLIRSRIVQRQHRVVRCHVVGEHIQGGREVNGHPVFRDVRCGRKRHQRRQHHRRGQQHQAKTFQVLHSAATSSSAFLIISTTLSQKRSKSGSSTCFSGVFMM